MVQASTPTARFQPIWKWLGALPRGSKALILCGLLTHLLGAVYSVGFNHADENWQVVEPASYLMGQTPKSHLAWEFPAQIRPWLQPVLHLWTYRALESVGVSSPKIQLMAVRLWMSALGFWSVLLILHMVWAELKTRRGQTLAIAASMLFWFHPWLHARTSSENLANSLGIFAVVALWRGWGLWAGLSFGLALQARYLMFFQTLPLLVLWYRFDQQSLAKRPNLPPSWSTGRSTEILIRSVIGVLVVQVACAVIDRWGYGEWVWPAWKYFWVNGVLKKSHQFGVFPWWDYGLQSLVKMPPVLNALALTVLFTFWAGFGAWVWQPKRWHWLTWLSLPFTLIHLNIGHKELRFLFTISSFLPLMLALWVDRLGPQYGAWLKRMKEGRNRTQKILGTTVEGLRRFAVLLFWGINIPYFLFGVLAAERNTSRFQLEIGHRFKPDQILFSENESDIFYDPVLPLDWGRPPGFSMVLHPSESVLNQQLARLKERGENLYFHTEKQIPTASYRSWVLGHCKLVYSVFPSWLRQIRFFGWDERVRAWSLWECS